MTIHDHLRSRLLQRAGLEARPRAPLEGLSFEELKARECGDGFCEMMDNRIVMGHLRYGAMSRTKPLFYDLKKARERLSAYGSTGNLELLVDAANYCRCEFRRSAHPNKHFRAVDRE